MSEPDLTPQEPGVLPGTDVAKLDTLAAGNVGDLVEALDQLSPAELEQLAAIEKQGKARTTALGAIQREIDSRDTSEARASQNVPAILADESTYANRRAAEIDPGTLTRPVLTLDGWLLPRPSATPEG